MSHGETLASALALAPLEATREAESPLSSPRSSSTSRCSAGAAANGGGGGNGGAGAWGWGWGLALGLERGGSLPFGACSAFGSSSSGCACRACSYAATTCAISARVAAFYRKQRSVLATF